MSAVAFSHIYHIGVVWSESVMKVLHFNLAAWWIKRRIYNSSFDFSDLVSSVFIIFENSIITRCWILEYFANFSTSFFSKKTKSESDKLTAFTQSLQLQQIIWDKFSMFVGRDCLLLNYLANLFFYEMQILCNFQNKLRICIKTQLSRDKKLSNIRDRS